MSLSHALRTASEGWTQTRLALATGISQDRLSRLLTGSRNATPTLHQIAAIEDAVGKPRGFVLTLAGFASYDGAVAAGVVLERYEADISLAADLNLAGLDKDLQQGAVDDFMKDAADEMPRAANSGRPGGRRGKGSHRPRGAPEEPEGP